MQQGQFFYAVEDFFAAAAIDPQAADYASLATACFEGAKRLSFSEKFNDATALLHRCYDSLTTAIQATKHDNEKLATLYFKRSTILLGMTTVRESEINNPEIDVDSKVMPREDTLKKLTANLQACNEGKSYKLQPVIPGIIERVYPQIVEDLTKAIELSAHPRAELYYGRATIEYTLKHYEKTISDCEIAISLCRLKEEIQILLPNAETVRLTAVNALALTKGKNVNSANTPNTQLSSVVSSSSSSSASSSSRSTYSNVTASNSSSSSSSSMQGEIKSESYSVSQLMQNVSGSNPVFNNTQTAATGSSSSSTSTTSSKREQDEKKVQALQPTIDATNAAVATSTNSNTSAEELTAVSTLKTESSIALRK